MRRTILLTAIVAVIAASAALAKSFPATIAPSTRDSAYAVVLAKG